MLTIGEELQLTFKGRTMTARIAGCDMADGWVAFYIPPNQLAEIVAERPQQTYTVPRES